MIERQRRKEMNSLFSELWSLLPQESIREKRSVADQLEEAANYGVEISKLLGFQESDEGFPSVKIKSFGSAAFQVYINSIPNQITLSDILLVLEECRVEVVSAASSVTNEKIFHTIHAKVTDHIIINFETLYVKLEHLIGYA
ncbi:hypothetical protein SUGI_1182820 [Cryptomeria japonica]|nr:hypothetical protein SUGI_1182820 [Cryptomeria japonica]